MRPVHALGDDALGELDAIGLANAIKSGRVGRAEVVEAAIARTEAVNSAVNGLACEVFDQARAEASEPAVKDHILTICQQRDSSPALPRAR